MRMLVVLAALALAGAAPCAAQSQIVPSGPKALSPEQEQAQKGIMLLRDSVLTVASALRQFQRDYAQASPRTLEAWARNAADRCAAAGRTVPVARALVASGNFVPTEMAKGQKDLVAAIDRTSKTFRSCDDTFRPLAERGKGEEVRAYGNRRAEPLIKDLQKLEAAFHQGIKLLGLDLRVVTRAGKAPV